MIAVGEVPAAAGLQAVERRTTTAAAGAPVTVACPATARFITIAVDDRLAAAGRRVAGPRSTTAAVEQRGPVAVAGEPWHRSLSVPGSPLARVLRFVETLDDSACGADLVEVDDDEVGEVSGRRLALEDARFQDRGRVGPASQ